MRIQLTGQTLPEDDPEIIIHGSIPKMAEKSCYRCAREHTCGLLSEAMKTLQILVPMPVQRNRVLRNRDGQIVADTSVEMRIPIPMPCRGDLWAPKSSGQFEHNPLINRLGLADVAENYHAEYSDKKEDQ